MVASFLRQSSESKRPQGLLSGYLRFPIVHMSLLTLSLLYGDRIAFSLFLSACGYSAVEHLLPQFSVALVSAGLKGKDYGQMNPKEM